MKSADVGILLGNDTLNGYENVYISNCRYTTKQLKQFLKVIKEELEEEQI